MLLYFRKTLLSLQIATYDLPMADRSSGGWTMPKAGKRPRHIAFKKQSRTINKTRNFLPHNIISKMISN